MLQAVKFLKLSVIVFRVIAFLIAASQIITGFILLIFGGEPFLIGGFQFSARAVSMICFLAAVIYFFSFWLIASFIQLLLEMHTRLGQGDGGGRT